MQSWSFGHGLRSWLPWLYRSGGIRLLHIHDAGIARCVQCINGSFIEAEPRRYPDVNRSVVRTTTARDQGQGHGIEKVHSTISCVRKHLADYDWTDLKGKSLRGKKKEGKRNEYCLGALFIVVDMQASSLSISFRHDVSLS